MPLSHTANAILYVPFSKEYTVPFERISELDMNTFFGECFVRPQLSKNIERLKNMAETEISDLEYPLKKQILFKNMRRTKHVGIVFWTG